MSAHIELQPDIAVEMRDGTKLRTDLYLPASPGPHPVLLLRIPYNKVLAQSYVYGHPIWYARRGFAVAVQDTRGRYASEGDFYPLRHEADDAFDTLTWLKSQPSLDPDRIGMYGFSYPGKSQLLLASRYPGSIAAMAPGFCGHGMRNTSYTNGVFNLAMASSWSIQLAADEARVKGDATQFEQLSEALTCSQTMYGSLPLESLAPLNETGRSQFYFDLLANRENDDFWAPMEVGESDWGRVVTPGLHFGGWYDTFINDTITNYERLAHLPNQHLLVGPWYHIPWSPRVGEVDFGPEALNFLDEVQLVWFNHWLKGEGEGPIAMPRVRLFVMGRNAWRDEEEFPLKRAEETWFYLHSGGRANSISGDGTLSPEAPGDEDEDVFAYNPLDPVPSLGGNSCCFEAISPMGAYDQRPAEVRNDVLVYSSEVLESGVEVTGRVRARLFVSYTAETTDFTVKLVDVFPDGRAINLCQSIFRTKRSAADGAGSPEELSFEVGVTSNWFGPGHRIRVEVSSSSFPMWERNLNSFSASTALDALISTQFVHHSEQYPSGLLLPVIPAGAS
ncbi:MAG: CocE/NonD family hydrolase [Dehalococcoidia bacterium]